MEQIPLLIEQTEKCTFFTIQPLKSRAPRPEHTFDGKEGCSRSRESRGIAALILRSFVHVSTKRDYTVAVLLLPKKQKQPVQVMYLVNKA